MWNGLPIKVVAAERVDGFKWELDALERDGYRDIGRSCYVGSLCVDG